ncbi:MAG: class I tRNA ligase family protein, partial [Rhodospirillales bacterium]|nr:class I tRNA ligase family protein [Rhodospirillales bacterium]
ECSAMSSRYLGQSFDIHGGGQDLIFPHHENEIAQSRSAHPDESFARVWMHNGYLMVEGEKMSKSLGNFITVHDLLKEHHGETIRLTMLKTHYRQPINWTAKGVTEAEVELNRFYSAIRQVKDTSVKHVEPPEEVLIALKEDLNTPWAISHLHDIVSDLNNATYNNRAEQTEIRDKLVAGAKLLGLLQLSPVEWLQWRPENSEFSDATIAALILERNKARTDKDFTEADRIRGELAAAGIILEDSGGATTWRRG